MSWFKQKEITAKDIHDMRVEVGESIEKYGYNRVREDFEKHYNRNVWLGFFVCLIPVISIILFFTIPALAAAIISVTMIAFILVIILNT